MGFVPRIVSLILIFGSAPAIAQTQKTATVDGLLQREFVATVLIDDARGVAYFERVDAAASSLVRFPYDTERMYRNARKTILSSRLDGNGEPRPLFRQEDGVGYYFASDNPFSPDRRYIAIYKLRDGHAIPGIVDLRRGKARFFDVSAAYTLLNSSLNWVSNDAFEIASAEGIENRHTIRVHGSFAANEAVELDLKNGDVTVDIVGAGKFATDETASREFNLVRINIRSGKSEAAGAWAEEFTPATWATQSAAPVDAEQVAVSNDAFYYLESGDLWRIDHDAVAINLTEDYPHSIQRYELANVLHDLPLAVLRSEDSATSRQISDTVFVSESPGRTEYLTVDADGRSYNVFTAPGENSRLLTASSSGAIFKSHSYASGSRLQYVKAAKTGEPITLYHYNRQLAGITPAVGPMRIAHTDYMDRDVSGWLYLPPGASLGSPKPYPMVMIPYDLVYDDEAAAVRGVSSTYAWDIWRLDLSTATAVEVYTAAGYAVLLPSIPLGDIAAPQEPMANMMPAITSSLDAAIDTGFVDPERVAIAGHSFGGYIALAVAVQTDRFRAVIAQAPVANLTSMYGQFLPYMKKDAAKFRRVTSGFAIVRGQARMHVAPWAAPSKYIRNSPLFGVQNVTTPIMLIHGDLDGVGVVAQAEEMFTALREERKDVVFGRYFGEHHQTLQPQNQSDMWRRIFGFLESSGVR